MDPAEHTTEIWIGGEAVTGAGEAFDVENPHTAGAILSVHAASAEQVDAAVATARAAWPAWARTAAGERCELLHEVARRLRADPSRWRGR